MAGLAVRHWGMPDHVAVVARAFCVFDLSVQDTASSSLKLVAPLGVVGWHQAIAKGDEREPCVQC